MSPNSFLVSPTWFTASHQSELVISARVKFFSDPLCIFEKLVDITRRTGLDSLVMLTCYFANFANTEIWFGSSFKTCCTRRNHVSNETRKTTGEITRNNFFLCIIFATPFYFSRSSNRAVSTSMILCHGSVNLLQCAFLFWAWAISTKP